MKHEGYKPPEMDQMYGTNNGPQDKFEQHAPTILLHRDDSLCARPNRRSGSLRGCTHRQPRPFTVGCAFEMTSAYI